MAGHHRLVAVFLPRNTFCGAPILIAQQERTAQELVDPPDVIVGVSGQVISKRRDRDDDDQKLC